MKSRFDLIKDKRLLVIGLGKTGISVIRNTIDFTSYITGIDSDPYLDLESAFNRNEYIGYKNLKIMLGEDVLRESKIVEGIDMVVISPGVPGDILPVKLAEENGIPVLSELELAWSLLSREEQSNTVAVTGTNGKTTVVTLLGKIFRDSKKKCMICGNIGLPLIDTVNKDYESGELQGNTVRVIEVSSFQLERIYSFKPYISIILNITSDHIDRHKSFENYGSLKIKMLSNQDRGDWSVINMDDSHIEERIHHISKTQKSLPKFIRFSLEPDRGADIFYKDNIVYYSIEKESGKISLENISLRGKHNVSNIMASIAPALLMNIGKKNIEKSVKDFKPLDHRIEYLGLVKKIRCFNDSKSTNPDATIVAISDFGKEITLIMGGKDKDMDFSGLAAVLNKKVKNLILIGEAASRIYSSVVKRKHDYRIYRCKTLKAAVKKGFDVAMPGEVLMLSPGCASMDMFKDYKQRGNKFKSLVFSE
jgi:UDP-N-acetylmuramoylalanine--D-glutamate ligase